MFEIFKKNEFDEPLFVCKTKLALAFANTMKGYVDVSEEILAELIKVYKTDIMDNEAISRWNLINVLNNFVQKKYAGLKEELFQVVTFAIISTIILQKISLKPCWANCLRTRRTLSVRLRFTANR